MSSVRVIVRSGAAIVCDIVALLRNVRAEPCQNAANSPGTRFAPSIDMKNLPSLAVALTAFLAAQTPVSTPENAYTPAQDVELGRKAADEVRRQLPVLTDDQTTAYVEGIGRRLVA